LYLLSRRPQPAVSQFKHFIYGLKSYLHAMGYPDLAGRALPKIRREKRLPRVLSVEQVQQLLRFREMDAYFASPMALTTSPIPHSQTLTTRPSTTCTGSTSTAPPIRQTSFSSARRTAVESSSDALRSNRLSHFSPSKYRLFGTCEKGWIKIFSQSLGSSKFLFYLCNVHQVEMVLKHRNKWQR